MLPSWHPERFAKRKANLAARQHVLTAIRGYFVAADFAEVETPALQISPGGEAHLGAFATELKGPRPGEVQRLYLHTSPEFAMKKLLVAGVPRLYQLAHVFRNGERSSRHHPEFLMLEWYRAHENLDALKQDCVALLRAALAAAGHKQFTANGMTCDPSGDFENLSVAEAFKRFADIDLLATLLDAPKLAAEAKRIDVRTAPGDTWDDLFFRIMAEKIEPQLGRKRPTFLGDYPLHQAALARPHATDPRLAQRFELYVCGIELANAFDELTDADAQAARLKEEMDRKEKIYGARWPVDEDFIAALRHGMPQSAGIALGVDRLIMLATGAENIEDVLWLPVT